MKRDIVKDAVLGVAVGDAIGVPVEFRSRQYLLDNPVTGVQGYGSHNQPPGTWSDDSSMTFCLAETLAKGYNLSDLASRFVRWDSEAYWTPHGEVFDMGIATSAAIDRLRSGVSPTLAGGTDEGSNGNGSLMRILPLLFLTRDKPVYRRYQLVQDVSSITHRHIRSVLACFIYLEVALEIISGKDKQDAYRQACVTINAFLEEEPVCSDAEKGYFSRVLSGSISSLAVEDIRSSGYVLHTLEAALWCFLTTPNYKEAVLRAVNLGEDTDTTGAVTGGLAGLYYGVEDIPAEWLQVLARREDIETLCRKVNDKLGRNG